MTHSNDSTEPAALVPAKAQPSVNAAKKTLRIFPREPEKSDPPAVQSKVENSNTVEKVASTLEKRKQDRRVLKPEFKNRFLTQLSEALGIKQTADLPKIFLAERVLPMKIGIANDLLARYPNAQDHKTVKKALSFLARSFTYSNAVIEEERRYDLDLNPIHDETGEITDQSRIDAQNNIKNGLAKIKKRRAGHAQ